MFGGLLWFLDYRISAATIAGLIAPSGIAAETGIVMLMYLNQAWRAKLTQVSTPTPDDLRDAIIEGALIRLRPKLMTVLTITVRRRVGLLYRPVRIGKRQST